MIRMSMFCPTIAILLLVWLPACGDGTPSGDPIETLASPSEPAEPRTAAAAIEAFNAYRTLAAAGNGEEAIEYIHEPYFGVVQNHIDLALDADRATIKALPFVDRYMVLVIRLRLEPERLRTISPRGFAQLAIENGWVRESVMRDTVVESVLLLPEGRDFPWRAEITMSLGGRQSPYPCPMFYEGGRWLVDLKTLGERGAVALERMGSMLGDDADDRVVRALAASVGKPVPDDVYAPIGRE